jgi:hypothetical protein
MSEAKRTVARYDGRNGWIELNAAANRLAEEWLLILPDAESIVRKVALRGEVRIRARAEFERVFDFPNPEQLDFIEGFLLSRRWACLEIEWAELIKSGLDYRPYSIPALSNASVEDIREAIAEIIDQLGHNPNTNELPPLVNDWLRGRGKKAGWAQIQEIGRRPEFLERRNTRGVTRASQTRSKDSTKSPAKSGLPGTA